MITEREYLDILNQNVNRLIQDVRHLQNCVNTLMKDSLTNHLISNGEDRTVRHIEEKSFAEKEYSDMTIAELRREQDKPIDKEPKS
jgi:hypothetical protein